MQSPGRPAPVPWAKAIKSPLASSEAPGPPQPISRLPSAKSPRQKLPRKLAANLDMNAKTGGFGRRENASDVWNEEEGATEQRESISLVATDVNGSTQLSKEPDLEDDVSGWDPMREDFESPSINAYTQGPGLLMQSYRGDDPAVCLYVSNIPTTITKEGIRNLFSRVGKVKRLFVPPPKTGQTTTYGFVSYGTIREAEQALQKFNDFPLGSGVLLKVKVAEKQEDREKRLEKKRTQEAFFKTLHCGQQGRNNDEDLNDFELDDKEDELNQKNPLMAHYNRRRSPSSNPPSTSPGGAVATSDDAQPYQDSLSNSAGAASLNASPMKFNSSGYDSTSPNNANNTTTPAPNTPSSSSSFAAADKTSKVSSPKTLFPCVVCDTATGLKCSRCHTPYCSPGCQKRDWPNHMQNCVENASQQQKPVGPTNDTPTLPAAAEEATEATESGLFGSSGKGDSVAGPMKLAEHSDDEGFVINFPKDDDLDLLHSFVHEVRSGREPGDVLIRNEGKKFKPLAVEEDKHSPSRNEHDATTESPKATTVGFSTSTGDIYGQPNCSNDVRNTSFPTEVDDASLSKPGIKTAHGEELNSPASGPFTGVPVVSHSRTKLSTEDAEILVPISEVSAHFNGLTKPLPSIPLTAPLPREFKAIVTSVRSCTCFNALVMSVEMKRAVLQMEAFANDDCGRTPVDAAELTQGSKCGYVNDQGDFFRVVVVGFPSHAQAEVKFQDCLAVKTVPTSSLCYLSEDILLLPPLTHVFSLVDLASDHGSRFLEELVREAPVHIKKVRTSPPKLGSSSFTRFDSQVMCQVESFDRTVNINEKVSQYLVLTKDALPIEKLDAHARSPLLPSTNPSKSDDLASPTTTEYKLVHYAAKIPLHDIGTQRMFTFLPTIVVSPTVIWGQVMHTCIENLSRLQRDLNVQYQSSKNTSYTPTVGEICAAKFSQDQCYYRSEILCVNLNGTIDVCYVDFGNRDTVTTAQLRYLDPVYLSLPKQGLLFSMAGISPVGPASSWSENSIAYLKDKIMNKKVKVEVVSKTSKSQLIKVFNPDCHEEVLNDSMVLLGHAQRSSCDGRQSGVSSPLLPSPASAPSSDGLRGVSVYSKQILGADSLSVKKEALDSQLRTPEDSEGAMLSADKTASGKQLRSPRDFMFPLTPPISPAEPMNDVTPPSGIAKLNCSDTSNVNPRKHPGVSRRSDDESTLSHRKNVSPPQLVKGPTDATQSSPMARREPHHASSSLLEPASPRSPLSRGGDRKSGSDQPSFGGAVGGRKKMGGSVRSIETVQPPLSSTVRVLVSHVETPLCFWVQMVDLGALEKFMLLGEQLNKSTLEQFADPRAGDLCACRSPEDNFVYRARITSISTSHAKVQYIDYGNSENVPPESVYAIDDARFLSLPAQAIMCSLNGLLHPKGRGEPWSEEATKEFESYFAGDGKTISLSVTKSLGAKSIADVKVLEEGSVEKDVLEMFVKSGHGITSNKSGSPSGGANSNIISPDKRNFSDKHQQQASSSSHRPSSGNARDDLRSRRASDHQQEMKSPFSQRSSSGDQSSQQAPSSTTTSTVKSPFASLGKKMPSAQNSGSDSPKTIRSASSQGCSTSASKRESPFKKAPSPLKSPVKPPSNPFHNPTTSKSASPLRSPVKSNPSNPFHNPTTSKSAVATPSTPTKCRPTVAALKKTMCPTDVDHFKAVITEIESPDSFFIQIAREDIIATLEELYSGLSSHFASSKRAPLSSPPAVGDLVCAKFSEDRSWYRSEVLAVSTDGKLCRVFFIDYGSTDDGVSLSDIAECPLNLVDVPAMAVKCALNGVAISPSSSSLKWSPETISFLRSIPSDLVLQARVVVDSAGRDDSPSSSSSSLPSLELVDASSGRSLAAEMISKGYAVSPVSNTSKPSTTTNASSASPGVGQYKATDNSLSSSRVVVKDDPSCLTVPSAKLPVDSPFRVQILDVSSPHEFRLQHIYNDGVLAINALMEDMQALYNNADVRAKYGRFKPQIGALCCAKYAEDNCWYRAKVVAVSGAKASVLYVDFGNTESVRVSEIFSLDGKFFELPCQAVLCSLSGVKPVSQTGWTSQAVECFRSLVSGSVQVLTAVVAKTAGAVVNVELYFDKDCTLSVAQDFTKAGHAASGGLKNELVAPTVSSAGTGNSSSKDVSKPRVVTENSDDTSIKQAPPPSPPTSRVHSSKVVVFSGTSVPPVPLPLSTLPPSGSEFKVLVVHVVSLAEFYLQVVTNTNVEAQVRLMEEMTNYCSSAKGYSMRPAVGELCLAQYSDGSWLRAQIVGTTTKGTPDSINVCFFDFGNTEIVSPKLLKPIPEKFLDMPVQSVRCGMYGVPACDVLQPGDTLDSFKTMVGDGVFSCDVKSQVPLLVDLKDISGSSVSVCDELVQMGLFPHPGIGMNSVTMNTIPSKDSSVVVVTEIKDPTDFWLQVLDPNSLSELQKVLQKVNEYCSKTDPPPGEPPVLGQPCCAKFSEDGTWYRAKVVEIRSLSSYTVHFIDFGNSEERSPEHIRPFKHEFMYLQAQAVHCCLVGFQNGADCSPSVVQKFREVCSDRKLVAISRGVVGAYSTVVELVDTTGSEDVYIHKSLQ